ncbi:cytochrome P450 [Fomitiporia mediterranea MF3/22]|uniref:cytochrome P450 n=1 Tax=Fomitiporia mediterranea (strain MF3/22) TaxID=694068 RepID=UPI00044098AD|nr:cytochrome P450 [Fomitiporia mediterranea MF3/22]EJD06281.1 cytochrome P450 [Fomitiporia mediterranea MF3/22]
METLTFSVDDLRDQIVSLGQYVTPKTAALVAAATTLAWLVYRAIRRVRVKSLIRGLPGPDNPSWLTGNFPEIYDVLNVRWHQEAVKKYGKLFQINGMFGDEQLYVVDPRAMHHVLVKENAIFEEPQSLLVMNRVLMGDGLLATLGNHHKKQRRILNPVFSAKHMRDLLPAFWPVTQKLCKVFESKLEVGATEINVYEWAGRSSLELLARGGLGTTLDSLVDGEVSEHAKLIKEMVPTVSRLHVPMQLLPLVYPFFRALPEGLRTNMLKYSPFPSVRRLIEITERLETTSRMVLQSRSAAVLNELSEGRNKEYDDTSIMHNRAKDILSALLRAQLNAPESENMPYSEVVNHVTTLIFTAQDTTASALSRCLHVLAAHPEAQALLRHEVRKAKEVADQTESAFGNYDDLIRLPFLDAVVRETFRMHTPVSWIWRVARAPTTLPLYQPIQVNGKGGKKETLASIPIAEGQQIVIGIAASHRDESTWGSDANIWRPERWLSSSQYEGEVTGEDEWKADLRPVPAQVDSEARYPGIYSGMMTFAGGGRSCIGFKFALLALKLQLAALVDRFEFSLSEEEIVWNMNHIAAPTVRGRESEGAQLPLRVSIAA